jgi:hypothetical protein
MKRLLSLLDVEADRIYCAVGAGKRVLDGTRVLNVGLDGLNFRIIKAKQSMRPIRMPRRDTNAKFAGAQLPNHTAPKKAGSTEHGYNAIVRWHHD